MKRTIITLAILLTLSTTTQAKPVECQGFLKCFVAKIVPCGVIKPCKPVIVFKPAK